MVTKKELEQEVKTLKRKLKENKEKLDEKELEQEVKTLKRKLKEKEEELDEKEAEMDSSRSKIIKQDHLLQQLKDKVECPVCFEMPRGGPVPVCPNGHVVCETCKRDSCPTCRIAMGAGKSLLAGIIVENVDHKCKFGDCNEVFAPEDIEEHEAVCPHRTVSCPDVKCPVKVPLSKLVDHIIKSKERTHNQTPREILENWNKFDYKTTREDRKSSRWPMDVLFYSGETFVVFPTKSEGQYYFVIVMFASETECSKYKFEMIIHDKLGLNSNSEDTVKFQGSPLSIDLKKKDFNFYSASGPFMSKLIKKSNEGPIFCLSLKLSKKEV